MCPVGKYLDAAPTLDARLRCSYLTERDQDPRCRWVGAVDTLHLAVRLEHPPQGFLVGRDRWTRVVHDEVACSHAVPREMIHQCRRGTSAARGLSARRHACRRGARAYTPAPAASSAACFFSRPLGLRRVLIPPHIPPDSCHPALHTSHEHCRHSACAASVSCWRLAQPIRRNWTPTSARYEGEVLMRRSKRISNFRCVRCAGVTRWGKMCVSRCVGCGGRDELRYFVA